MKSFEFEEIDLPNLDLAIRHPMLLSMVAPRPIAWVATRDSKGRENLAPFSFFNALGSNPPMIGISPAFGGKDGAPKHTFLNILETKEFTISAVSHGLVEQANLSSCNYPAGVDEFEKAGVTKWRSKKVEVPGVAESPCILECRFVQHVDLGGKNASGNLLIGEVLYAHLKKGMRGSDGLIDPHKMDLVSRLGYEWYGRSREGLFEVEKPRWNGMGWDAMPEELRDSSILTGNQLARLASLRQRSPALAERLSETERVEAKRMTREQLHRRIQEVLGRPGAEVDGVELAWGWIEAAEKESK